MTQINATPNLNGNTPDDFKKAGLSTIIDAQNMRDKLSSTLSDVFHGRNYQTPPDPEGARNADIARLREVYDMLDKIEEFGMEIYENGAEA